MGIRGGAALLKALLRALLMLMLLITSVRRSRFSSCASAAF